MMARYQGILGLLVLLGMAVALSSNRKAIRWKIVWLGSALQFVLAVIVLKGDWLSHYFDWLPMRLRTSLILIVLQIILIQALSRWLFQPTAGWLRLLWSLIRFQGIFVILKFNLVLGFFSLMRNVVNLLIAYSAEGAKFIFGPLAIETGERSLGFIFGFQVLPTIIFVASIFAILYYLGIMQLLVQKVATIMSRWMSISGAESVSVAASIFMGQAEAPLTIRPFIAEMTRSELMTIMTAGMAHVSGAIMAAYVLVAHVDVVHLLTAVVMTAPGAIMISKIIVPETETPRTKGGTKIEIPSSDVNLIDAAARGASEGLQLSLNVGAMLIAFIALVALANGIFGGIHHALENLQSSHTRWVMLLGETARFVPHNVQQILGAFFSPMAWLMGVSWKDSIQVGNLLGTRMVLNEFVSFLRLGEISNTLDHRSFVISTFALCGFANFGSIAIQVGGIGALAPSRRHDLASLGLKAMIAGTIANFLSATIAGIII